MLIVNTSYSKTSAFKDPHEWLDRIRFFTEILEELARKHRVCSLERIQYEGFLSRGGVDYYFLKQGREVEHFPIRSHRLIRKLGPAVVLVNGFIFPLQVLQLRWRLGRDARIFLLHRADRPGRGIRKKLQRWADRMVDGYFFVSHEQAKEWIREGIIAEEGKIHEIMQASSPFRPADREQARRETGMVGAPVFLWVGRLEANKDPLTVIRGFLQFHRHHPGARLYMIYQEEPLIDEVRKLLEQEGAGDAVHLLGRVAHAGLQNWYSAADYILSGSRREGSGIAVCEAISCGCIPVVTDIDSFRRMTDDGRCGYLYRPGDAGDLFHKMMQAESAGREEMRSKVLQGFEKNYSPRAIAGKMLGLFENGRP